MPKPAGDKIILNLGRNAMKFSRLMGLGLIALMLGACGGSDQEVAMDDATDSVSDEISVSDAELAGNPFMH
jgi:hypothetical protein